MCAMPAEPRNHHTRQGMKQIPTDQGLMSLLHYAYGFLYRYQNYLRRAV